MRIKLKYLQVRSGGPNFIPSVRGPVRLVRSEKYTQPAYYAQKAMSFIALVLHY